MVLYRVVTVDKASDVLSLKTMRTSPRPIQSWTVSFKAAKWFFNKQYASNDVMELNADGGVEMVDKSQTHDFVIVQAEFSGASILWTPETFDRLERYQMHAYDSKLYGDYYRLSSGASEAVFNHRSEQEVIVYVPRNAKITIQKIIPIHIRDNQQTDGQNEIVLDK